DGWCGESRRYPSDYRRRWDVWRNTATLGRGYRFGKLVNGGFVGCFLSIPDCRISKECSGIVYRCGNHSVGTGCSVVERFRSGYTTGSSHGHIKSRGRKHVLKSYERRVLLGGKPLF